MPSSSPGPARRQPGRRRWWPGLAALGLVLLGLACFVAGAATATFCYQDELARGLLLRVLARLERPGIALRVERVLPRGLHGVTLYGLHYAPRPGQAGGGALSVDVGALDIRWSDAALWRGRLELTSVELIAPRVKLDLRQGLGDLQRELAPFRRLLARKGPAAGQLPARDGDEVEEAEPAAKLPRLQVQGGVLELTNLGLGLDELALSLVQREGGLELEGTFRPLGLQGGPCRIAGKLAGGLRQGDVQLDCATPLTLRRGEVALHAARLGLSIGQLSSLISERERQRLLLPHAPESGSGETRLSIAVPSLEVIAPVPGDAEPRPRLSGALRIVLGDGATVGVEADLHTLPAGKVVLLGHLQPQLRQAVLDLHAEGLDLAQSPLPALLPGMLSSGTLDADVAVDLVEHGRRVDVIGQVQVRDLVYFHERLARSPVPFASLEADLDLSFDIAQRRLESVASRLRLNRIPLDLDGEVDLGRGKPLVRLSCGTGRIEAADLAASVPKELIPRLHVRGLEGHASFAASLMLDIANPEGLRLRIDADVNKLKIRSLGAGLEVEALAHPFVHTWEDEEREELYRLESGPGSASWVPLNEVPRILLTAILAQEDGGFHGHHGFSLLHVKGSLIQNLRSGRFARGASTISMQLARNLFLGREKLLSRKLQEVVLTWRLEQELDKERILELYVNVIEWGRGVFGLRAAAAHYFGKAPFELGVAECLFLSTAIPRPRAVDKLFLAGKGASRYHTSTIKWMMQLLHQRGHLDAEQYRFAQEEPIRLRDPATIPPPLKNLWDTVPHRGGSHQIAPSPRPEEEEEEDAESEGRADEDEVLMER